MAANETGPPVWGSVEGCGFVGVGVEEDDFVDGVAANRSVCDAGPGASGFTSGQYIAPALRIRLRAVWAGRPVLGWAWRALGIWAGVCTFRVHVSLHFREFVAPPPDHVKRAPEGP